MIFLSEIFRKILKKSGDPRVILRDPKKLGALWAPKSSKYSENCLLSRDNRTPSLPSRRAQPPSLLAAALAPYPGNLTSQPNINFNMRNLSIFFYFKVLKR